MKKILTAFALLFMYFGGLAQWTQCNGPEGGNISFMEGNLATGSLFTAPVDGGLFRYTNASGEWEDFTSHIPSGFGSVRRMSYGNSGLYLLLNGTLFRSADDGFTWNFVMVDTGFYNNSTGVLYCRDDIVIVTGNWRRIYVSSNSGQSFTEVSKNLPDAQSYYDITMMGNRLFLLGAHGIGYFNTVTYSDDLGLTWKKPTADIHFSDNSGDLWLNRFRSFNGKIYSMGSSDVWVSEDQGVTWDTIEMAPQYEGAKDLFISGDTLLVGTTFYGLFISKDAGNSYTLCSNGLPLEKGETTQIIKISGGELYLSTAFGIYRSFDNGATWNDFNTGLNAVTTTALALLANQLFAGTTVQGIFVSSDEGQTWTRKSSGMENFNHFQCIRDLCIAGNRLVAGTDNGVFLSDNFGNSWSRLQNAPYYQIIQLCYQKGKLYAGTVYGIITSTDTGNTWHKLPACDNGVVSALLVSDSLIITSVEWSSEFFQKTQVMRSDNGGISFSVSDTNFLLSDIEMLDSVVIGAGRYSLSGLFKSFDYGKTWQPDTTFGDLTFKDIYVLDSKYILAASNKGKVYMSRDTARTWEDITGNFRGTGDCFLWSGRWLYLGSNTSGVWKRDLWELTGTNDRQPKGNLHVYPNPTDGEFCLSLDPSLVTGQSVLLTIYNLYGRCVVQQSIMANQCHYTLSLEKQSAGSYFLILEGISERKTVKIMKTE